MKRELRNKLSELRRELREKKTHLEKDLDEMEDRARDRFEKLLDRFDMHEVEELYRNFRDIKALETLPHGAVLRPLPIRHELKISLDEALMQRKSLRDFSGKIIPEGDLAAILWACHGINRADGKRTTPSAMNWQEVDVYVVQPNGIWKYLPKRHALLFIVGNDCREHFGDVKTWMKLVGAHLVFVSDARKTNTIQTRLVKKTLGVDFNEPELCARAQALNVGTKLQAAALATAALGLAGVPRILYNEEKARRLMRLQPEEKIMAIYSIGFPSQSFFDHVI